MSDRKVVYLDSNDYSILSEPRLDERLTGLKEKLLYLNKHTDVMFAFSGVHISEMSPIAQNHADAATRRTSLLSLLCHRNAMISFDRLIRSELERLVIRSALPVAAIDTNGEWFPDFGSIISPLDDLNIEAVVQQQAEDAAMNRKARRMLKSTMISKNGAIRSNFERLHGRMDHQELTDKVPMRPRDARVLQRYVLGHATRAEADAAFLESLRDPSYMMQWFAEHYGRLGAVGDWVRQPARDLLNTMQGHVSDIRGRLSEMPLEERKKALSTISGAHWAKIHEASLLQIVNRLIRSLLPGESVCDDVGLVDQYCPGLSTCLRTLYSSVRNSFGENSRAMSHSDFVDALHATYVPYVSFFRADRYMTHIIRPHAERFGTKVLGSLDELVEAVGDE
ncbi:hypothetical protein ACCM60_10615 [Pseudomonas chlororaphis subsp. aureofaciens]|uniref:hypothetical protein n=1 Tax=Pseudomonas chlororaphis TaxID=587753 RepID=UPI0035591812